MAENKDGVNEGGHVLSPNSKVLELKTYKMLTAPIKIEPPLHPEQEACEDSKSEKTLSTDAGTS